MHIAVASAGACWVQLTGGRGDRTIETSAGSSGLKLEPMEK